MFAVSRTTVGALTDAPGFGFTHQFQFPACYLSLVEDDGIWRWTVEDELAWSLEGRRLLLNRSGPINLRWVGVKENVGEWDALFVDAFSFRLAYEICEQITGSDIKKRTLYYDYQRAIRRAMQRDALE